MTIDQEQLLKQGLQNKFDWLNNRAEEVESGITKGLEKGICLQEVSEPDNLQQRKVRMIFQDQKLIMIKPNTDFKILDSQNIDYLLLDNRIKRPQFDQILREPTREAKVLKRPPDSNIILRKEIQMQKAQTEFQEKKAREREIITQGNQNKNTMNYINNLENFMEENVVGKHPHKHQLNNQAVIGEKPISLESRETIKSEFQVDEIQDQRENKSLKAENKRVESLLEKVKRSQSNQTDEFSKISFMNDDNVRYLWNQRSLSVQRDRSISSLFCSCTGDDQRDTATSFNIPRNSILFIKKKSSLYQRTDSATQTQKTRIHQLRNRTASVPIVKVEKEIHQIPKSVKISYRSKFDLNQWNFESRKSDFQIDLENRDSGNTDMLFDTMYPKDSHENFYRPYQKYSR